MSSSGSLRPPPTPDLLTRTANELGKVVGGVVSPLLANLYMNRFLKHWRTSGRGAAFRAHIVAYADDFVILSGGHAAEALAWTRQGMGRLRPAPHRAENPGCGARPGRLGLLRHTVGPP